MYILKGNADMNINLNTTFGNENIKSLNNNQGVLNNKNNVIDGKTLNLSGNILDEKKAQTKKDAMKLIRNAFEGDQKISNEFNEKKRHIEELIQSKGEADKVINDIENERKMLRDEYGLTENSKEEKELKLLEKDFKSGLPGSDVSLSEEERKAVAEIKERGLTEYQSRSMEKLDYAKNYIVKSYANTLEIQDENRSLGMMEREMLKNTSMIDAQKQAKKVEEELNEQVVSIVVDEAKDNIDSEIEEKKEEAEKIKEKKEEIEERIDASKKRRDEMEDFSEKILEGAESMSQITKSVDEAQQEVKEMMTKMKMLDEDIKGIEVDDNR